FPDYGTSIGEEIARALQGEREYGPDVMQLLYVANRYERKPDLRRWLDGGLVLVCDRYLASSVAYGEAFGLDPASLLEMPPIPPPRWGARRRAVTPGRATGVSGWPPAVRDSSRRRGAAGDWVVLDGGPPKAAIAADVLNPALAVLPAMTRLAPP